MISLANANSGEPWKMLASLPDPVGFAGMAVGVCDGKLLAAGGSRFLDKPIWHGGVKSVSDRVFLLPDADGSWKELGQRLPFASAHPACAAHDNAIYAVGGINARGALKSAMKLSLRSDALVCERLPDFPKPLAYGSAVVAGTQLYVLGGVTDVSSMEAHHGLWALSLKTKRAAWKPVADFPGRARFGIALGAINNSLLAFGGYHLADAHSPACIVGEAFHFQDGLWRRLPGIPEPRVGAASPCPDLGHGRFLIVGGYSEIFKGAACDNPGFDAGAFIFDAKAEQWSVGPALPCVRSIDPDSTTSPGPEPMIAAGCAVWNSLFVLVGGEVRPATRTPAVLALPLSNSGK